MATIASTLALQDQMSPAINAINSGLSIMMTRLTSIQGNGGLGANLSSSLGTVPPTISSINTGLSNMTARIDEITSNRLPAFSGGFTILRGLAVNAITAAISKVQELTGTFIEFSDATVNIKARIDAMNDGLRSTEEVQRMIFAAAERSKGEYMQMSDVVARIGTQAKKAFPNTEDAILFAELLNKTFVTAGTSASGVESVMYNLVQALGSGVLRGQDLNSVFSNTPQILEYIAKYLDTDIGKIRQLAEDGELSANVIKNAMFAMAGTINEKFEKMPATFATSMNHIKNYAALAFTPVAASFNKALGSDTFKSMSDNVINAMAAMANIIGSALNFIMDNINVIQPIISGLAVGFTAWAVANTVLAASAWIAAGGIAAVGTALASNWQVIALAVAFAAMSYLWNEMGETGRVLAVIIGVVAAAVGIWTVAQWALNIALTANPIGVVIMAIGALIAVITAIIMWVYNLWQTNVDFRIAIIQIWNGILDFFGQVPIFFQMVGNGIADAFSYAKVTVLTEMQNMANGVIGIINGLINAVNRIPGVSIGAMEQVSFAAQTSVAEEANRQQRAVSLNTNKALARSASQARNEQLKSDEIKWRAADNKPKGFAETVAAGLPGAITAPAGSAIPPSLVADTGKGKALKVQNTDKLITDEDLKLLSDIATMKYQLNYQQITPQISLTFGDVRETADVDGIVDIIADKLTEVASSRLAVVE